MERYVFKLPDIGEGVAEAEIVSWHVQVGTTIAEDDPLVDVMTDKATVEIPAPRAGKVLAITGSPGEKVRVGTELLVLEIENEPRQEPAIPSDAKLPPSTVPALAAPGSSAPSDRSAPASRPSERVLPKSSESPATRRPSAEKPLAAPTVRQRARQLGIPLQLVPGTGPDNRISHADLDGYVAAVSHVTANAARPTAPALLEEIEEIKVIGLRRRIAERMQESKRHIPHYSYVEELDITAVEELRAHLNARYAGNRPRLTLLPFLIRALAHAVPRFPQVNARFDDEAAIVRRHKALHVGIATQTVRGLLVPVLRHAEALDLWETASEITRLAAVTRDGKATRDQLTGSTITITSLGAMGGIVTTPVINYPEVAIIGVNRIVERPVVRSGQIVVRKMMNLSSSFDHRIVDGRDAAEFIQELRDLLEQPATLFVD